jgi:hypothetical protein
VSLKGKLVHATNGSTMLMQDVAYPTSWLERTKLSEKMIEEDLSRVDECVTRSIHKLGWVMRDVRIKVKRVLPSSFLTQTITKRKKHKPRDKAFVCIFCGRAGHLDEF